MYRLFFDSSHCRRGLDVDAEGFCQQHFDNLLGGAVAEKLALVAFLIGNTMSFNQGDEVVLSIAGESRDAETRVLRKEVRGRSVEIGEIGAPTPRNADFPADI